MSKEIIDAVGMVLKDVVGEFEQRFDDYEKGENTHREKILERLGKAITSAEQASARVERFDHSLEESVRNQDARRESAISKLHADIAKELAVLKVASEDAREHDNQTDDAISGLVRALEEDVSALSELELSLRSFDRDLERRVEKILERIEDEEESLQEAHGEVAVLKAQIPRLDALETALRTAEDAVARMRTEAAALRETDHKIETWNDSLERSIAAVRSDLREATEELTEVKTLGGKVESLLGRSEQNKKLDEALDRLSEADRTRLKQVDDLDSRVNDLVRRLTGEVEAAQSRHSTLGAKIDDKADIEQMEAVAALLEESTEQIREALTATEENAEVIGASLRTHEETTRKRLEHVEQSFAERYEDVLSKLSGVREQVIDGLGSQLKEIIEARAKLSDQMLVDQARSFIDRLSQDIKGERGATGYLSRSQAWVKDYEFSELSLVTHKSGLWQALRNTSDAPFTGAGSDWICLAAGVEEVTFENIEGDAAALKAVIRDSKGGTYTSMVQMPTPRFLKTWEKEREGEYRFYDSVVEDGHRWLAVKDNPKGPPSKSKDWALFGMRGPRGVKGPQGPEGAVGPMPPMNKVLDAWFDWLSQNGDGTPLINYRGGWEYGATFSRGDVINMMNGLFVAVEDHVANRSPLDVGQNEWVLMVPPPGGGGAGGGGGTDVTLAGAYNYLTLAGQVITRHQIDLATDVTGNLAVTHLDSGTNATGATFWAGDGTWKATAGSGDVAKVGTPVDDQVGVWTGDGTIEGDTALTFDTVTDTLSTVNIAVTGTVDGRDIATDGAKLDGIEAGADVTDTANVTAAGALMDSEVDANLKTLTLPASTTIAAFGATLVDDANQAAAQATLGVDPAGTDNSTDVTLAGTPNYLTLAGQVITRNQIDLTADVSGILPIANIATGTPDGTKFVRDDGTLAVPAGGGGGDVSKVGTPVDNQVGVWTGDGTIEGGPALTFDGTTLDLGGFLDVITGNTTNSAVHIGEGAAVGTWITTTLDNQVVWSGGAEYSADDWVARSTAASQVEMQGAQIKFYINGGLTPASPFTPTQKAIMNSAGFDLVGNFTLTGTVDGRDVATDGTKLDNIEPLADVTDATNVDAAGAVMDGDFSTNGLMKRDGAGSYSTAVAGTDYIVDSSSPVWTGVHDFGGATSLELPNGTSPTVDAAGEIALDTDGVSPVTSGVIRLHDGAAQRYLWPTTNAPTSDNDVMVYDSGTNTLVWESQSGSGGGISNIVEDTTPQLGGQLDVNGFAIGDGTLELLTFTETGSAVNQVNVTNAATGNAPSVGAAGDDTDIDLNLVSKGTGVVKANGTAVSLAGHTHAASDVTSGTFADARIAESNVTQHEGALTITESQISDLGAYITGASPTITTPTLTLKQSTTPTPTAEGDIQWDTDDNTIVVGDGASAVTFLDSAKVLQVANDLSDLNSAATARSNLGVDAAGTDNSTDVTLAGTSDYITISGQVITRNAVDLAADVTGNLPVTNLNSGTGATGATFWAGDGTWKTPAGSGDVSKVGTPVDNQIGVWTGDGTIEGDTALTFDTSTDTLAVGESGKFAFGAVNVLDDTSGTTTLSNIDAIDSTTKSTVQTAIDTLANLTSVQGHTVTLTGAFIRSGAHSLTMTTTGTTTVTLPLTGTLSTLAGAETLTNKIITGAQLALQNIADPGAPATGRIWQSTTTANTLKYRDSGGTDRIVLTANLSQTVTNKAIDFATNTLANVMSLSTAQSVTAGIKKTFQANATNAGFRLAGVTADPSAPVAGDVWYRTDVGALKFRDASASRYLLPVRSETHTWAISGEVKVPSGDTDYIVPFFVMKGANETVTLTRARHRINSGTSATVKLTNNGSDITGWTGISVTTTSTTTSGTATTLSDTVAIALVVTGVSGTPTNLSFTIELTRG